MLRTELAAQDQGLGRLRQRVAGEDTLRLALRAAAVDPRPEVRVTPVGP